jgi:hypothetical protein
MTQESIPRYPLLWPTGWKRTPANARLRSKFSRNRNPVSVFEGVQRVMNELERMGIGDWEVVISTNVPTRLDGLPRSNLAEPSDPGAAVYWQIKNSDGRRCMAIDSYDTVAGNLAAIAATLEAMRAIERHGGAAILDRAFTGFTALPAPAAKKTWREILDVPANWKDLDFVRNRYRRAAAEHHPDRGGSAERMAEINAAWEQAQKELA